MITVIHKGVEEGVVIVGGGPSKNGLSPRTSSVSTFPDKLNSLQFCQVEFHQNGTSWERLPDLPLEISSAQVVWNEDTSELFVFGGYSSHPSRGLNKSISTQG